MIYKISIVALSVFSLINVSGCFRQSPPPVQSDYVSGVSDQIRLDACSELDFNNNFLSHSNVKNLFLCTRWNEGFADLYNGIASLSPQSWNYLTAPISRYFFDDHVRRDLIIDYLRELDSVGALDDLGHVLSGINEINFYTGLKQLFMCIDGVGASYCRGLSSGVLTQDDVINIGKLLIQDEQSIAALARMVESISRASENRSEPIRHAVSAAFKSEEVRESRIQVLNSLLLKYKRGVSAGDKKFYTGLFARNGDGESFFYNLLNSSDSSLEDLESLVTYFINKDSEYLNDIIVLNEILKTGIECKADSQNRYFKFSFSKEVEDFNQIVSEQLQEDVFDYLIDRSLLLRAGEQFCAVLNNASVALPRHVLGKGLRNSLSFFSLLERSGNYIENNTRYSLASFLTAIINSESNSEIESGYLVSLISGELSFGINELNKKMLTVSPNLYRELLRVAMSLPRDFFEDLEVSSRILIEEENILRMKSAQVAYHFFNNDERSFIFNFLDKHFEQNVNFVALFKFYSRILYEYSEVASEFQHFWFGQEDAGGRFYSSLRDFSVVFAGEEILSDFRLFYSRQHIIEVIRVIANGAEIKSRAERERRYYKTSDYLLDSVRTDRPQSIIPTRESLGLQCLGNISEKSFYQMIQNYPEACKELSPRNISLDFMQWLSLVQVEYSRRYSPSTEIFNMYGVLSPRLLAEYSVALAISSKNGILSTSLRDVIYHLLYETNSQNGLGHVLELEAVLDGVMSFWNDSYTNGSIHRNSILKNLSLKDELDIRSYLEQTSEFLKKYSHYLEHKERETGLSPDLGYFSCRRYINQRIGYRCPASPREIVRVFNELVNIMFKEHRGASSTLFEKIYDAFRYNGGTRIPMGSSSGSLYRLTLNETLKMLHSKSDKSLGVNNLRIPYVESGRTQSTREQMTTMERIELVIRDVRFGRNYLGVQYMNYVAFGDNYNANVENRKQTLSNCVVIPVVRCGKRMSRDERRQAENALEAFDGLLDANNGRGLEASFSFGRYMQALLSLVVGSSSTEAQNVRLLPLANETLLEHNGVFLGFITELAGLSNIGRWLHSRLFAHELNIQQFLNMYGVRFVDEHLFKDVDHIAVKGILERIIQKTRQTRAGSTSSLEDIVSFIWNADQDSLLELERMLAQTVVLSLHLGKINTIDSSVSEKFSDNNIEDVLIIIETFVDIWPHLKTALPRDYNLMDGLLSFKDVIDFMYQGIEDDRSREIFYRYLNESFLLVKEILVNKHSLGTTQEVRGLDQLQTAMNSPQTAQKLVNGILSAVDYFKSQKYRMGSSANWYESIASFMDNLVLDEKFKFRPYLDFLMHTTKERICTQGVGCEANIHFDFPYRVVDISLERVDGQSRLKRAVIKVDDQLEEILLYLTNISRNLVLEDEPAE
jgi:hypothetical protein